MLVGCALLTGPIENMADQCLTLKATITTYNRAVRSFHAMYRRMLVQKAVLPSEELVYKGIFFNSCAPVESGELPAFEFDPFNVNLEIS